MRCLAFLLAPNNIAKLKLNGLQIYPIFHLEGLLFLNTKYQDRVFQNPKIELVSNVTAKSTNNSNEIKNLSRIKILIYSKGIFLIQSGARSACSAVPFG